MLTLLDSGNYSYSRKDGKPPRLVHYINDKIVPVQLNETIHLTDGNYYKVLDIGLHQIILKRVNINDKD